MYCNLGLISYGKHNNLHVNIRVAGNKKHFMFLLKCTIFFDYECACIFHTNIHPDLKTLIKFDELTKVINTKLSKYDVELRVFSENDFFNRNIKSEELLKRLENEN